MNDWLNPEEDEAIARVRMSPLEDIVCGLGRLGGLRCAEITSVLRGHVDLDQASASPEKAESSVSKTT